MRTPLTTAVAALPLLALACSQRTDSASRTDSAAASTATASLPDSGRTATVAAASPAAPAATARSSPDASAAAVAGSDSTPRKQKSKTSESTSGSTATGDTTAAAGGQASDSGKGPYGRASQAGQAASTSAAPAGAAAGATSGAAGGTKVNEFMSYDAAGKTTDLKVVAAYNHTLGGFNFNGGARGSHVITVPEGWTVRMDVRNVDAIPHSAIVIKQQQPLPNAPERPDISRAYTAHVNDGLPPVNGEDMVTFRASPAGSYWIYCGVPGHGPSGMYISLIVTPGARAPTYKMQ